MTIIDNSSSNQDSGPFITAAIEFVSHLSAAPYPFNRPQAPRLSPMAEAARICEGAMRRYATAQTALANRRKWADTMHAYVIKRAYIALTANHVWSEEVATQYGALVDCIYDRVRLAEMTVSMERYEVTQAEKVIESLVKGGQ